MARAKLACLPRLFSLEAWFSFRYAAFGVNLQQCGTSAKYHKVTTKKTKAIAETLPLCLLRLSENFIIVLIVVIDALQEEYQEITKKKRIIASARFCYGDSEDKINLAPWTHCQGWLLRHCRKHEPLVYKRSSSAWDCPPPAFVRPQRSPLWTRTDLPPSCAQLRYWHC